MQATWPQQLTPKCCNTAMALCSHQTTAAQNFGQNVASIEMLKAPVREAPPKQGYIYASIFISVPHANRTFKYMS
jgi:hypothetical protein